MSETAQKVDVKFSTNHVNRLKLSEDSRVAQGNGMEVDGQISQKEGTSKRDSSAKSFIGGPSSWYCFFSYYTLLLFKQASSQCDLLCLVLLGTLNFTLNKSIFSIPIDLYVKKICRRILAITGHKKRE